MTNGEFSARVLPQRERMYRLAKSMLCDSTEAEDVVQDVFEKLWIKRESLDEFEHLNAFILASVRNTCIDRIRTRKTRQEKEVLLASKGEPSFDTSTTMEVSDIKNIIQRIIAGLPERQQTVIHLRDIEGCEMTEIAELVGMDEATVRMTLSRARKTVREKVLKIMNYGLES